ncbi:hypothetical protein [Flexivirga sp.]|uniref:hypothetical protein n=1 Tax=Flexivirga sp. TaxID=1962927 RepID=UPI003F817DB3
MAYTFEDAARDTRPSTYPGLMDWLMNGERGCSSETMARHLTGRDGCIDYPHDPADFRRCVQLLDAAPLIRTDLPRMATASPEWEALVARWNDIEQLLRVEMRDSTNGTAPATYALVRHVISTAT